MILLNCLPPADVNNPSISLSILKKFMLNNGVDTEIKYWNFLLSIMSDYTDSEETEKNIIPFLSIINNKDSSIKGKQKQILDIIKSELKLIDFSKITLFGISAKYNQWLPGIVLATEIKKIAPDVKIIIGGFGTEKVALEAMKKCNHFDFCTWGEGEYPLLETYKQLENKSHNFKIVPRLMYRENNEIKQSITNESNYLDFDNYIFPDFNDFIDNYPHPDSELINIPINTIRSCHWRKCKFCDFNEGYKLRIRKPECIIKEIEHLTNEYGITTFTFVDSDTFGNLKHFEKLLNLIIELKYHNEEDYIFWAEIIPNAMINAKIVEKMAIAGFKNIFIGYDALCDSLLKKMNKRNSFSDNLFLVKHSLKNGISPLVNLIKHIPDETKEEVIESKKNMHFLRFFYNNSIASFSHNYVNLVLSSMSKYYSLLSTEERNKYDKDAISNLLPEHFSNGEERFHLFRYENNTPTNVKEWEQLIFHEDYYKKNKYSYTMLENNGVYYYTEYCNDTETENIIFGVPEYVFVLKAAGEKIYRFSELYSEIKKEYNSISEERLKEILKNLKASYLLYYNEDYSGIISVV